MPIPSDQLVTYIPWDVIMIIASVICAIACMQLAGGMDYLVSLAEKALRKNPKYITFAAPVVTYLMTMLAGTGHTAFSTLPVIAEVAKEQGIRPSRPLSIAVIASQIAITASPISAAVVAFSGMLEPFGVDYLTLLAICIPSTFIACILGAFVANMLGKPLDQDEVYLERKAKGLIPRDGAIMGIMLAAATIMTLVCKLDATQVTNMPTFKSGMSACICVLGVAWLGNVFVKGNMDTIQLIAGDLLNQYSWLLAVVLFFAAMLLYSQGATTKALMPAALALGVSPLTAIASFAAVSALFVLPTYPTLLAAVEMDDTGSTRIGKAVFNHPFFVPGVATIAIAVALGFFFGGMML